VRGKKVSGEKTEPAAVMSFRLGGAYVFKLAKKKTNPVIPSCPDKTFLNEKICPSKSVGRRTDLRVLKVTRREKRRVFGSCVGVPSRGIEREEARKRERRSLRRSKRGKTRARTQWERVLTIASSFKRVLGEGSHRTDPPQGAKRKKKPA